MIKNIAQLNNAQTQIESARKKLEEYKQKYDAMKYDFYAAPLIKDIQNLEDEIQEYLKLTSLPFKIAVREVLSEPILLDNISDLLAKLRIAAKLTQSEMADLIGWEQPNLSRFENENYSSQTVSKIIEIVSALGVYLHVAPSFTEELEPFHGQPVIRKLKLEDIAPPPFEYSLVEKKSDIDAETPVDVSTQV